MSRLGLPRAHFACTSSTNDRARELARRGAPHGALVTAAEQTGGRGRQGRTWVAPAGRALLCSLVVRDPPRLLPLAAAVAVASEAGEEALIKWPNDVLVGCKKVAGILVEGRPQESWAVLGIGLNVAVTAGDLPPELRAKAAGLGREPGDVERALAGLLVHLEEWLSAPAARVLDAIRARDALAGRMVSWPQGSGRAAGIDGDGRLIVEEPGGRRRALQAGEVHLEGGPV